MRYPLEMAIFLGSSWLVGGCADNARTRGKIAKLEDVVAEARAHGAKRCAPRELAMAESHLKFASLELDQGFESKAKRHLWIAEPNAHAAHLLSPNVICGPPKDQDGDGLLDSVDRCPDEPENHDGFEDDDGCPDDRDTDGDRITDSNDSCVLDPEDTDRYLDRDGCPDADNDLDGIADASDTCPIDAEDPDGFEDENGCPDLDNDRDSVADLEDQCPNEIGPADGEPKGCPKQPALAVVTDCEVKITEQIHFAYNKDVIRRESFPVLDAVVDILNRNPDIKLEVQGHTDNRGAANYNKSLSQRRSAAVMKYLVTHGIAQDRLRSAGYGFDRPLVPNDSDRNRALNRRVQFMRTEGTKAGCSP